MPRPPRMSRSRQLMLRATLTAGLAAIVVTAGCGAPGSGGSGQPTSSTSPPSSVATDPGQAGDVTLNVWDQEVRGGQNAEMTALNKAFEAKYPNITIKRTSKSFSDLKTTLRLALSGANPPDVVEANQGYPDMVTFVKAGMLVPLDAYADTYGWTKRYPKTLLDLNRVSTDAKHFGTGQLYGISQMGEYIGIYYNKSKLDALGLQPPTSWSEFTTDLATIKAKGQLPIMFGNLDKFPAIHTFGLIQDQVVAKDTIRGLVYGTGDAKWTDPKTVEAATTMQQWVKQGYFNAGVNGLGYDDAAKQYAGGKGVFLITGTWEAAELAPTMKKSLGLMPPPPASAGAGPVTTGGESLAFAVTSKSTHRDVAAAYLNFLTDAKAADVMTKTGNLPAVPGPAAQALSPDTVQGQMVSGWTKIGDGDGLLPYLDYSTPTFFDTLTAALQELIGGQATPQQFTQKLQTDYAKFHSR